MILGVRPTDFALPTGDEAGALPRIRITPEVVESLGAESNVIFPVDAPRVDSDAVRSAADNEDGTLFADEDRALFTARFATRTPISRQRAARARRPPARDLHYFDPDTGVAL